jgi:hypothetical protein
MARATNGDLGRKLDGIYFLNKRIRRTTQKRMYDGNMHRGKF